MKIPFSMIEEILEKEAVFQKFEKIDQRGFMSNQRLTCFFKLLKDHLPDQYDLNKSLFIGDWIETLIEIRSNVISDFMESDEVRDGNFPIAVIDIFYNFIIDEIRVSHLFVSDDQLTKMDQINQNSLNKKPFPWE